MVNENNRNRKLRLLVARLNKERKKQAKQTDILCNDLIAAYRQFIKDLAAISFAAGFYEAIAGATNLKELLYTAGGCIRRQVADANVAFFLQRPTNFELHIFEGDEQIGQEDMRLENCFTTELVCSIAKANKTCSIEDMLGMGLEANPACLEKFSVYAIPLAHKGVSPGFILIYRSSRNPLTVDELRCVCGITTGLCRSIASCRLPAPAVPTSRDC